MLGGPIGTFIDIGVIIEVVPGFGIPYMLRVQENNIYLEHRSI